MTGAFIVQARKRLDNTPTPQGGFSLPSSPHDAPALLDPLLESEKYNARSASVEMTPVTIDRTDVGARLDDVAMDIADAERHFEAGFAFPEFEAWRMRRERDSTPPV